VSYGLFIPIARLFFISRAVSIHINSHIRVCHPTCLSHRLVFVVFTLFPCSITTIFVPSHPCRIFHCSQLLSSALLIPVLLLSGYLPAFAIRLSRLACVFPQDGDIKNTPIIYDCIARHSVRVVIIHISVPLTTWCRGLPNARHSVSRC